MTMTMMTMMMMTIMTLQLHGDSTRAGFEGIGREGLSRISVESFTRFDVRCLAGPLGIAFNNQAVTSGRVQNDP